MDVGAWATPNCPHCQGRGRRRTGEGINDYTLCVCASLNRRRATAEKLIETSFSPRARAMTLASYETGGLAQNEQALRVARNFVENLPKAREEGWVLGFWGKPRSGKTHLAMGMGQAAIKRYLIRAQLLNVPKALRQERERFQRSDLPSPFTKAAAAELLILDDIGAEYERLGDDPSRVSWVAEQLYILLDERLMANLPLIYTSNLSPSDMERRYSNEAWKRVYERLRQASVTAPLEVLAIPGLDHDHDEAEKLLFA